MKPETIKNIIIWMLCALMISIIVMPICILFYMDKRTKEIEQANPGCEYLGQAKHLSGVYFFDCDGQIIMKRNPK